MILSILNLALLIRIGAVVIRSWDEDEVDDVVGDVIAGGVVAPVVEDEPGEAIWATGFTTNAVAVTAAAGGG